MSEYFDTVIECGQCGTDLAIKVTQPGATHGQYSSFVHADRIGQVEPEYCRDDDGSSFAADQAEPMCPCCGGPLERSVHSRHWVCVEHGSDHYQLTEDGAQTTGTARINNAGVPA